MKRIPLLVICMLLPLFANSEEELVKAALKHSYGIQLKRIEHSKDSIKLQQSRDLLLPQTTFTLAGEILPLDSLYVSASPLAGKDAAGIKGESGISLSKAFSKGGTLSASLGADGYVGFDDTTSGASSLSLNFSQPLLKDSWQNSDYHYQVTLDSLSLAQSKLQTRSTVIHALSEIRSALITIVGQNWQLQIIQTRQSKAERKHEENLQLVKAGKLSAIDTLASSLNLVRIAQDLFSAESTLEDQKSYVNYLCGSSVNVPGELSEEEFQFPQKGLLLTEAMKHPDISLLDLVDSTLSLQIRERENSTLPDLNFTVGATRVGSGEHLTDEMSHQSTISIGLSGSFSLPLRKVKQDIAMLQRSRETQSLQKKERKAFLEYEIDKLERLWYREHELLKLREKEEQLAKELFDALTEASKVGAVRRTEYEDAESDHYEAATAVAAQRVLLHTITVSLEKITGGILERYGVRL